MAYEFGLIGAGNMAEAIARAAIDRSVLGADQMIASDPSERRRSVFSQLGIMATAANAEAISQSKQVMVAVKPQMMDQAAHDLGQHAPSDQVVVSIMAGVSTAKLGQAIAAGGRISRPRIIRVMPNTPLQVGLGMAGVALGRYAQPGDESLAMRLFAAAGKVVRVEEPMLDAITAVSGSGPAYVFYLAEAMAQAAQELGVGEHAASLVQQTVLGAAQLLTSSTQAPAELRRRVTSPGGTTEAAIGHMDANGVKQAIVNAIKAAHQRSIELGG